MSLFTLNVAPSGSFFPTSKIKPDAVIPPVPVCNPGVFERQRGSYQTISDPDRVDRWLENCTGEKKWEFTTAQIDAYADVAVRLAAAVAVSHSTCRLAPLRGAARPCMLVEVMTRGTVQFEFFDFRLGSHGRRDAEIRRDLMAILDRTNSKLELFRIQIIDTAIGGNGIEKLVSLLQDIHDNRNGFQNQRWFIDIHLLHPTNGRENLKRIRSVEGMRSEKFQVHLSLYPVPELVAEDYDEALGFEFERAGSLYVAKPSIHPGRFLLRTAAEVHLVESEDLSRTFDEFFSEAVTNSLLTDPDRELVEIVWQEYQAKA